jgi:hypothetical protein
MSTIDIGIAELPARTSPQPETHARPAGRPLARAMSRPTAPTSDFYVGSVKIDVRPPNGQSVQTRPSAPAC